MLHGRNNENVLHWKEHFFLEGKRISLFKVYKGSVLKPGGYLAKFNTGRLRPEVQPLTLLCTILAEKVPLLYTFLLKKGNSFTYLL